MRACQQQKDCVIRTFSVSLIIAVALCATALAAEDVEISVADGVVSYVNIRAKPTTDSAVIGALRPGKSAPLIDEYQYWYAVELSGGATGYVSRYWTQKKTMASTDPVHRPIYTADMPDAKPEPDPEPDTAPEPDRDRSLLARASALLEQDRAQDAYLLLANIEKQWGGDTGFDYLYGIAALDSGHPGESIFALERVIRSLPGFVGARMELARALYETGDRERAEQEFTALLDEQPPAAVRGVIVSYLDAMRAPPPDRDNPDKLFYAMASGGYDSNANGAADINNFLGFTLDPRNTEQDSAFVEARLGGLVRKPLRSGVKFIWQGDIRHRHNPSADFVDHSFASTMAGFGFSNGANEFNTGVAAYWSALDGGFNERSAALDLGWTRSLKQSAIQLTLRAGPVEFTDVQKVRDIDRVLYTFTLRQPLQGGSGAFDWTLIGGRDLADDRSQPYSNSRYGGRLSGRWKVSGNDLMFGMGLLKIPYNGNRNFFGTDRDDQQFTTTLSVELRDKPVAGWTFVPNVRYVKNESNVAIFDYDRVEIGLLFRVAR